MPSWAAVQGVSLSSSPSSEDGIISVCPATTVTLTCTASGVAALAWRDETHEIHVFFPIDFESEDTKVVHDGPFTATLVAIESDTTPFTSTLDVVADGVVNGSEITCLTFLGQDHFIIYKKSERFHL